MLFVEPCGVPGLAVEFAIADAERINGGRELRPRFREWRPCCQREVKWLRPMSFWKLFRKSAA